MKKRNIWLWAVVFGLIASVALYLSLFSKPVDAEPPVEQTASSPQVETKVSVDTVKNPSDSGVKMKEVKAEEPSGQELLPFPNGKRAMSIAVDTPQGVSGFVKPGAYIDIISLIKPSDGEKKAGQHDAATLLLQKMRVLGVGQASDNPKQTAPYSTVTLEVSPTEGLAITLAMKNGLYLMLRNPSDNTTEPTRTHIHEDEIHKGVFKP
jgi:pilus assembly protein CpaB